MHAAKQSFESRLAPQKVGGRSCRYPFDALVVHDLSFLTAYREQLLLRETIGVDDQQPIQRRRRM